MKAEGRRQKEEGVCGSVFNEDGFQLLPEIVSRAQCDVLAAELSELFENRQTASKSKVGGIRNILQASHAVAEFAGAFDILAALRDFSGESCFPVRAIFFDKTPDANWSVPWHQDLAIAVSQRIEVSGFSGWSVKDGVVHVNPPRDVLEKMIVLRLHLDDCDASNGALKVIPRSHQHGKLSSEEIDQLVNAGKEAICELSKGGALVMRPLLLHASNPSENPSHRRVLHIEYAATDLPGGLKWIVPR